MTGDDSVIDGGIGSSGGGDGHSNDVSDSGPPGRDLHPNRSRLVRQSIVHIMYSLLHALASI